MGWPTLDTPEFYVHDRECTHCGKAFRGYINNKYCSQECKDVSARERQLRKWGML